MAIFEIDTAVSSTQDDLLKNKINFSIRAMQTGLKKHRDSLGKETKQHHYINELRLIKFAMTGNNQHAYDLSDLSREHLTMLRRVICLNRRLTGLHVAYALRKQACRDFALKKLAETQT